jgi:hypothetical protein
MQYGKEKIMKLNRWNMYLSTLVAATFLAGCGSDSDNNPQSDSESSTQSSSEPTAIYAPPADNSNEAQNAYGYYGESAKFGELQLMGEWEYQDQNATDTNISTTLYFRQDGSYRAKVIAPEWVQTNHGYYGVDLNGSGITLYQLQNEKEGTIIISSSDANNCFHTQLSSNNGSIIINTSYTLCRKNNLENTLNAGNSLNNSGYYGQNVMFGDDTLVGRWSAITPEGNTSSYTFESNATAEIFKETNSTFSEYGVDETGEYIYLASMLPLHLKEKTTNHCYNVAQVDTSGNEEQALLFCKEE